MGIRGFSLHLRFGITLALVVAACGGPATSAAPSASTPASATTAPAPSSSADSAASTFETTTQPSTTPLPTATPGPGPIVTSGYVRELAYVNQFVMRVAVSDLNVREKPTTSARSNGKAPKGGLFMMYDWPVRANGYTWYAGFTLLLNEPGVLPDLPESINTGYDEVLGGWMATGTEDNPFLIPLAPRCPTVRDLRNVVAMLDSERLNCFGSASIELQGTFGCGGCGGATEGSFEPAWLAHPLAGNLLWYDIVEGVPLELHFPPDGPTPPAAGSILRVKGHFADARSDTCRVTEVGEDGELSVPIANEAVAQWCRGKYVVDSYEVIGTGPLPLA